jgi:hypothetical protein
MSESKPVKVEDISKFGGWTTIADRMKVGLDENPGLLNITFEYSSETGAGCVTDYDIIYSLYRGEELKAKFSEHYHFDFGDITHPDDKGKEQLDYLAGLLRKKGLESCFEFNTLKVETTSA